jgi:hypothetical protein
MKLPRLLIGLSLLALACSGGNDAQAAKGKKKGNDAAPAAAAATIGDRTITLDEVDQKAQTTNMQAYQALLELEAKERGMTAAEVLEAEAEPPAISDAEVQAFYDQNKARMRGQTIEQAGPQIRQFLAAQQQDSAVKDMMSRFQEKYAVKIALDPPRVADIIAENDPYKGPKDAKITIIEYSEFQ